MPNTYACKVVFNPIFPPNSAEGCLHFSAFHLYRNQYDSFPRFRPLSQPTTRHRECVLLLTKDDPTQCQQCVFYHETLRIMAFRHNQEQIQSKFVPSSHVNYRYLTSPQKKERLRRLHDHSRSLQKKLVRHQEHIAALAAKEGVHLDIEMTDDLHLITEEENSFVVKSYLENSFQRIFWIQQREASCRSSQGMHWHLVMIKWCLYLCHQSSKAYELRVHPPSFSAHSSRLLPLC